MEKIEVIRYGDFEAKINLSRGANCISLRMNSFKILREPDYTFELDNPYVYGMPILFPVNRISGGYFVFEGREYKFPINEAETNCHLHGSLHQSEFVLTYKTDSRIICTYYSKADEPYSKAGNCYKVELEYELNNDGFHQCVSIENMSDKNMPVMIGFHTTFNTLFAYGTPESTFVYAGIEKEYERNVNNYLPTGNILEFDDVSKALANGVFKPFDMQASRHYKGLHKGKMVIYDSHNNLSIVYETDEKYKCRLIYNGGEYICLEPQNCLVNCPNYSMGREEAGFDFLKPGEIKKYYSKISICNQDKRPI